MQRAGETAPRLIAARRDVVEEVPARDHRLFQASRRVTQLILGFFVLPQESRGHAEQTQHPDVARRKAVPRVVDSDGTDPPFAGPPWHRDRVLHVG